MNPAIAGYAWTSPTVEGDSARRFDLPGLYAGEWFIPMHMPGLACHSERVPPLIPEQARHPCNVCVPSHEHAASGFFFQGVMSKDFWSAEEMTYELKSLAKHDPEQTEPPAGEHVY